MEITQAQIIANENSYKKKRREVSQELKKMTPDYLVEGKDCLSFLNLSLYQISLDIGYRLFMHDVSKAEMPTQMLNETLTTFTYLTKFQIGKVPHEYFVLSHTEISENFDFWSDLSYGVLIKLIKKEYYCLKVLDHYFILDNKWMTAFNESLLGLIQTSINFIDVKSFSSPQTSEEVYGMITNQLKVSLELFKWGIQRCEQSLATTKNTYWGTRAVQLIQAQRPLFILMNDSSQVKYYDEVLYRLENRLSQET